MKLFNCKIINANNQQVVSNSNLAIPIIPFSRDGFDTWAVELKSKVTVMQIQVGDNKTFWVDGILGDSSRGQCHLLYNCVCQSTSQFTTTKVLIY